MDLLIGLDVGTTATKALLFDLEGRALASASQSYGLITPQEGWVEQDPEALWAAVVTTLRSLAQQLRPSDRVLAIGQSSQGGTTIPVDAAGHPVYNAISWMDQRARAAGGAAQDTLGEELVYRITGWPLQVSLPLKHITWLREHAPQVFGRARRFLFVNDFIGQRLTGAGCMDPTDASITHLFNIETGDWDDRLLALAGISRQQLSPVAPSGTLIGRLTEAAGAATGLPAGLPLINGAHDQYCVAVGLGVTRPGPVQLSCGTAWVLLAVPETLEIGVRSRMALSCHAVPGRWGALSSLGGVGASLEWLIDQVFSGTGEPAGRERQYAWMNEAALNSTPGAGGLLFYPLSGGHSGLQYGGRGGLVGLTLSHSRGDLARAIMEGIAYDLRWTLEEIQAAGLCMDELKMVGGAARSPIWPQIVADITGLPVALPAVVEAASWGAAILAGVGAGVFPDAEAVQPAGAAQRRLAPDPGNQDRYRAGYEQYRTMCPRVCKF